MSNQPARTHWKIMCDVIFALIIRELKTRFGTTRLGYFWALAEPVAQVAIMGLIFTLLGRTSIAGIPVALFLFSAILPFKLFGKLLPQLSQAVNANKGLLSYRQVNAIDPVIARVIIEVINFLLVYLVVFGFMGWLGFDVIPHDLLELLAASGLLAITAVGLGLMLCSAVTYWKDTDKVVAMVMQPMFFVSGIFFCAPMIPPQYWYLFDWNPIFHAIELSRDAFFEHYRTPVGSFEYLGLWALFCFCGGLAVFHHNRMRFLTA
ncbi:ABC transporter permease [Shewanella khirikhana]|uniref:ABC transporter permease n=1 Tax=Shewanella khirikhana TaxID=1965282 RepID=UPI0030D393B6